MASPAYEQILKVQGLDLSLRRLRHRHQSHPARDDVVALASEIAEVDKVLADIDSRHHELERQRKRLEDEAASIKSRRDAIDGKLYGGQVTASKDLLALQDEAAMLLGKQTELEDQELDLMELLEAVEGDREARAGERERLQAGRNDADAVLRQALAEIDNEIAAVEAERADSVVGADQALFAHYEALRDLYDGVAVARLVNGSCDGCHIQLSAVVVDQMTKMAEDSVVTCEECGRLLVR